ncbi:hypothetical protein EYF80_031493 [Liparis tanakae]|uniref:Uncharacterized protein n=1 Tax=Liparis tanakae TaxID=230148 RepID=A0A4Z2GYH7_9TELE|nr:hypothetical protein EYF80_031493 [Liparis tanakae]
MCAEGTIWPGCLGAVNCNSGQSMWFVIKLKQIIPGVKRQTNKTSPSAVGSPVDLHPFDFPMTYHGRERCETLGPVSREDLIQVRCLFPEWEKGGVLLADQAVQSALRGMLKQTGSAQLRAEESVRRESRMTVSVEGHLSTLYAGGNM